MPFEFDKACKSAFDALKASLTSTPVIHAPNWELPFDIMCNASNHAVSVMLRQRVGRASH